MLISKIFPKWKSTNWISLRLFDRSTFFFNGFGASPNDSSRKWYPQSTSQIMRNPALSASGGPSGLKEAPEPYFLVISAPFAAGFKRFCCDFVYELFKIWDSVFPKVVLIQGLNQRFALLIPVRRPHTYSYEPPTSGLSRCCFRLDLVWATTKVLMSGISVFWGGWGVWIIQIDLGLCVSSEAGPFRGLRSI